MITSVSSKRCKRRRFFARKVLSRDSHCRHGLSLTIWKISMTDAAPNRQSLIVAIRNAVTPTTLTCRWSAQMWSKLAEHLWLAPHPTSFNLASQSRSKSWPVLQICPYSVHSMGNWSRRRASGQGLPATRTEKLAALASSTRANGAPLAICPDRKIIWTRTLI